MPHSQKQRIQELEQAFALEGAFGKVSGHTMMMQKSDELAEVASLVFQQLKAIRHVGKEEQFHISLHKKEPCTSQLWNGQDKEWGLSLACDNVKANEGEVKVNSIQGEGNEFIIILPLNNRIR